jgi:hypothetical protein
LVLDQVHQVVELEQITAGHLGLALEAQVEKECTASQVAVAVAVELVVEAHQVAELEVHKQ